MSESGPSIGRATSKKLTRRFTLLKSSTRKSNTSSLSSFDSDSETSSEASPPTSPTSTDHVEYFQSSTKHSKRMSNGSTYDLGYGSGKYAVNLEESIAAPEGGLSNAESTLDDDEEALTRLGLMKFGVQDYLSLL